jgi:hypothetical protein
MSKMDGLRAMREARYEERQGRGTSPTAVPKARARLAPPPVEAVAPTAEPELPETPLCGHRAMSGRTCTRDQGHAAKSHRYG